MALVDRTMAPPRRDDEWLSSFGHRRPNRNAMAKREGSSPLCYPNSGEAWSGPHNASGIASERLRAGARNNGNGRTVGSHTPLAQCLQWKGPPMEFKGSTLLLTALLTAAGATGPQAQSLKEKQIQARQETELAKDVEFTNKTCGSELTVRFDWSAVPAGALEKFSAEGYCDAALESIRRVCTDAPGKDAVKQRIKSVTCGFGRERAISLKEGLLDYTINFNSVNDADFVYAYLLNNL